MLKKYEVFKMLFAMLFLLTTPAFSQQTGYRNPIIPGFYPDPSICRVEDDYYIVNSSFEYFPGVPVWHSTDMVHWKQIGNVLNRPSQLDLKNAKPSNGIYAPTIRYHNGTFYMVTTLVNGDRGYNNFYVTSKNPEGSWSDPIWVDQNGIDPSLFWDDDGRAYFVSNRATKPSDPRAIYQSEIDINTGKRLTEIKELWKGSGGSYVEGPHMYKKDGYYYLLTAEGGTSYGHTVAIGRSKNIWGPFESCPHNPILTNRMTYGSIQGTGHGDLVQAKDGSWWMVHLAFRPAIDGIHFIGRETCLTPVEWETGKWPVVNKNGTTDEVIRVTPPGLLNAPPPFNDIVTEDFNSDKLNFDWLYLRNPETSNYSLSDRKDWLSLKGSNFNLSDLESPTFIAKRQQHFNMSVSTRIDFDPKLQNEEAGLTVLMTNLFHYDFFIKIVGRQRMLIVRYALDSLNQVLKQIPLKSGPVELKVTGDKKIYRFSYKEQGDDRYSDIAVLNTRFMGTEVTGGYNGVILGIYATGNGTMSTTPAFFDWFEYNPL
jgi:xylan 1,4-beta-xylosidase